MTGFGPGQRSQPIAVARQDCYLVPTFMNETMADILAIRDDPARALTRGCDVLSAGQPLAVPTETVYGLAADATDEAAVSRIYEVKGRPALNPLICHVADFAMAERFALFDPQSASLAQAFWPGPLTLVVPLKEESAIHPRATAGRSTVALRMPEGFTRDLIAEFGRPVAAPSANTSGRVSPTTAAHVAADLGGRIPLILDGGPCTVGVESTIVKFVDGRAHLLRPGGLPANDIEAVIGTAIIRRGDEGEIEAPGMMASHYAPDARVRLNARQVHPGEALIRFSGGPFDGENAARAVFDLGSPDDLREAAARLFGLIKQADASGAETIAIAEIPARGIGEAINDRLRRAAAGR